MGIKKARTKASINRALRNELIIMTFDIANMRIIFEVTKQLLDLMFKSHLLFRLLL